jgi:hypothetical protein
MLVQVGTMHDICGKQAIQQDMVLKGVNDS